MKYLPSKLNTIKFKLSFAIGVLTCIFSFFLIGYFYYTFKSNILASSIANTQLTAKECASKIQNDFNKDILIARNLALIFKEAQLQSKEVNLDRETLKQILKATLKGNPSLLGIYSAWEPNAFDAKDELYKNEDPRNKTGVLVPYYYFDEKKNIQYEALIYYKDINKGQYFLIPQRTKKEVAIEPMMYKVGDYDMYLMTMSVPIIGKNNQFLGVVGVDINVTNIQKTILNTNNFDKKVSIALVSNKGLIVASSTNNEFIGENLKDINKSLFKSIQSNTLNFQENENLYTIVPIKIGNTDEPWHIIVSFPMSILHDSVYYEIINLLLISALFVFLLIIFTTQSIAHFLKPMTNTTKAAQALAVGNTNFDSFENSSNEIKLLNDAFDSVVSAHIDITKVCEAVALGDYSIKAIIKSENDLLSKSVNSMVDNLKKSKDQELARIWINEGFTAFSEILRSNAPLNDLTHQALHFLIKYVKMAQGGIYLLHEDKNGGYLELSSAYAYERKKYIERRIEFGEGLIGQAFLEKETIYMTQVPKDYIKITSGLGEALPTVLLIMPLQNNNTSEGILELASFDELEPHKLDFLHKCAKDLAVVVGNVRSVDLTAQLLKETTEQSQMVKLQEEEMRQNLEELHATQEHMNRREQDYIKKIEELMEKIK